MIRAGMDEMEMLEEEIVGHPARERFVDSGVFVGVVMGVSVVVGLLLGLLISL